MRKLYILLPAILLSVTAIAKNENAVQSLTTGGIGGGGSFPHYPQQPGQPRANVSLRLVGKTFAKFDGNYYKPIDSIAYKFNSDRGGFVEATSPDNDENILFHESFSFRFVNNNYQATLMRAQEYDAQDRVTELKFANWKASAAGYQDSAKYFYQYDGGQMIKSEFVQWYGGMWTNAVASDISYDGTKVTKVTSPVHETYFVYDASDKLVSVTDVAYKGGTMQNTKRNSYSYGGEKLYTHMEEIWNAVAGKWENGTRWTYTYAGAVVYEELEEGWNGNAWVNTKKHSYTYDAGDVLTEDITLVWDATAGVFRNSKKLAYTYNNQKLPELITGVSWNGSAWISAAEDLQYRFYYETYFPSSVEDIIAVNGKINAYPSPASEVLNIGLAWNKPQNFTVSVYDMRGAVIRQWEEPATGVYQKQMPVSDLPTGNYFIRINSANAQLTERFVVSR